MRRRAFLATSAALAAGVLAPWARAGSPPSCPGPLTDADLEAFRSGLDGTLILPSDASYASARLVRMRRFSPAPVAIVRASSVDDVIRTIEFARSRGVFLAPRSGAHSYVGASGGDGLVLDVSELNAIEPLADGAFVRVGAGTRLGAIYRTLYCSYGRTVPSGTCTSVGVSGITLGGGYALSSRSDGLTLDRLRSATVVLASGETVTASEDEHPDLFWALRGGGGGAFGFVTDLTFETVPYRPLSTARINFRWADMEAGFEAWQQFVRSDPHPDLVPTAGFSSNPAGSEPLFRASVVIPGTPAEAQALLSAFLPKGVTPASIVANAIAAPGCTGNDGNAGTYGKQKSAMPNRPMGPAARAVFRDWFERRRADASIPLNQPANVLINAFGGVIGAVAPDATAFPHRDALFSLQFLTEWTAASSPATVAAHLAWIRGFYDELRPLVGPACYANYADEDLPDWPTAYWGANLPELQRIKRLYDPDGFFRGRHTVPLGA